MIYSINNISIIECVFLNNNSSISDAGALCIYNDNLILLLDLLFKDNLAILSAGALLIYYSNDV